MLPLDDFYQVPTTWGFYGSDTLPIELIHRPTITRNPQRYIGDSGDFDDLVQAVQDALEGGDPAAVPGALRALGVSHVIVRKDIDFASPIRTVQMTPPGPLLAGLASVAGVRHVATTAVADVYEFTGGNDPVVALSGTIAAPGTKGEALASLVASAPAGTAIATAEPAQAPLVRGESWYLDVNGNRTIAPPSAGEWLYQWHTSDAALLELLQTREGVVLREPVAIRVGGRALPTRADDTISAIGPAVAAAVDGSVVDLSSGRAYAGVAPGTTVTPFTTRLTTNIGAWSPVGDCDQSDPRPAGLRAALRPQETGTEVQLTAERHAACVSATLAIVKPGDVVHLAVEQRAARGAPPRTCLWQTGLDDCARLTWTAERDGSWYVLSATYRVPSHAGALTMYLYADAPPSGASGATQTAYRNVVIGVLAPGHTAARRSGAARSGFSALGRGPGVRGDDVRRAHARRRGSFSRGRLRAVPAITRSRGRAFVRRRSARAVCGSARVAMLDA